MTRIITWFRMLSFFMRRRRKKLMVWGYNFSPLFEKYYKPGVVPGSIEVPIFIGDRDFTFTGSPSPIFNGIQDCLSIGRPREVRGRSLRLACYVPGSRTIGAGSVIHLDHKPTKGGVKYLVLTNVPTSGRRNSRTLMLLAVTGDDFAIYHSTLKWIGGAYSKKELPISHITKEKEFKKLMLEAYREFSSVEEIAKEYQDNDLLGHK